MGTRVGTLQAPKADGSILLAAFLASFVMLTIAVAAFSLDRDQGRPSETTFTGRPVVNTPSELSAGIIGSAEQTKVGGTAANTPSELNARVGGGRPKTVAGGTLANTPTELSGGVRHRFVGNGVGTNTPAEISGEITMVNGQASRPAGLSTAARDRGRPSWPAFVDWRTLPTATVSSELTDPLAHRRQSQRAMDGCAL